jgi:hypothetical protein
MAVQKVAMDTELEHKITLTKSSSSQKVEIMQRYIEGPIQMWLQNLRLKMEYCFP